MVPIALADNCPLIGRALSQLLAKRNAYLLIWHARTERELFQCLDRKRPQLLIVDPILGAEGTGLHLVEKLHQRHKRLPILIYTGVPHREFPGTCLQLGAGGFLTKDSPEEELLAAIHRVADGHLYLNLIATEQVLRLQLFQKQNGGMSKLTPREQQVLGGLVAGLPLKVIAEKMECSVKTVSTYRTRILDKLNCHSNADLVRYCQDTSTPKAPPRRKRASC
jgi:DNA-binding NarL/FixJ family response regulator